MKKIIIFFGLLMVVVSSISQTTTSSSSLKTDYLKKSKGQKTAAWFLLGGGTILVTTGLTVGFSEVLNDIGNIFADEPQKTSNTGEILFYTGLASMAGSIPLFIASSNNKKKANAVAASFKIEQQPSVLRGVVIRTPYPAIAVKISL